MGPLTAPRLSALSHAPARPNRGRTAPVATRPAPSSRVERGFTLVEILVVLIVLGIAAGITYTQLDSDPRRALETEARRLASALEHASILAHSRNTTLGVSGEGTDYRFWQRDSEDRWVSYVDRDRLAARRLPAGMSVRPLSWAQAPVAPDTILPIRAGGHNDPFAMELELENWRATVSTDPLDRVSYSLALREGQPR